MIQLRDDIAWVRAMDGQLVPFDTPRLTASIQRAVGDAGHDEAWLSEPIASAIHLFVRDGIIRQTISIAELAETIETVLEMLGYGDISQAYAARPHRTEIRLDEMAARSLPGVELDFYRRLDTALGIAADGQMASLQMRGLRSCVMRLRGARRWSEGCRQLADEIVRHVRARVRQLRPARAASLDVALLG